MDAFTPAQTTELMSRIGAKKAKMRVDKLFFNSVLAGPLLGFGCALALSTETAPWFTTNAPGLIRTIGAFFFPVGLTMIVLTGADLCTSNFMFMTSALLERRCSILDLLKNWAIVFLGNLAGMLFFMAIITGYGGVFDAAAYRTTVENFATAKVVTPGWHQIFLRGIGCNWLVCLAVLLSISAREIFSKVIAVWLPIMTFVGLGLDHVVANMYFIPMAIFLGSSKKLTVGYYIWKSMIPSLLGNILGAVLFISIPYWYLYLTGTGPDGVPIHFDLGGPRTAYGVGGPIDPNSRRPTNATDFTVGDVRDFSRLPDSGSVAMSGLAEELAAEKYGKRKLSDSESPV